MFPWAPLKHHLFFMTSQGWMQRHTEIPQNLAGFRYASVLFAGLSVVPYKASREVLITEAGG